MKQEGAAPSRKKRKRADRQKKQANAGVGGEPRATGFANAPPQVVVKTEKVEGEKGGGEGAAVTTATAGKKSKRKRKKGAKNQQNKGDGAINT